MLKKTPMEQKRFVLLSYQLLIILVFFCQETFSQAANASYSIGTSNGVYDYAYNQTPAQIVQVYPPGVPNTGFTYKWYSSSYPTTGFTQISGATAATYNPPALTTTSTTMYYYQVATSTPTGSLTSNTVKIAVVSVNWEDINYIREHDVLRIGQTNWTVIDSMSIGTKLQTTTYVDGLGRSIEKISKQTATPPTGNNTWGDLVQFSQYDA